MLCVTGRGFGVCLFLFGPSISDSCLGQSRQTSSHMGIGVAYGREVPRYKSQLATFDKLDNGVVKTCEN